MLKFELDEYNPSVLRHIGNALAAIAADREAERGCKDTDLVTFGPTPPPLEKDVVHVIEPVPPPLANLVGTHIDGRTDITVPPAPPLEVPGENWAAPPVEEDDDFPNPPGTVPAPPATDVPPPPATTELDSAGIPWDARIHATTKTKCKDLTWKNKPGVDPALLAAVTAELKGVQAIPAPPAAMGTPTQTAPATFAELVAVVGPFVSPGGKLMPERAQQVNEICQNVGLPNLGALGARTDLIPTVWSQLCLIL